jgi:hypothetical protein
MKNNQNITKPKTFQHKGLASGRWLELSFAEQMGNIGSEVHRSITWFRKKDDRFQAAFERALELFDLTIAAGYHKGRLKELCRSREYFCTLMLEPEKIPDLESELTLFDNYFTHFALLARKSK